MTRAAPQARKPVRPVALQRRLKPALQGDMAIGTLAGYGSVFRLLDSYGTVMMPGCFTASLDAHRAAGTMPKMLWQHMPEFPIGTWTAITEDDTGLWCEGALLLDVEKAREAHALLKAESLDGLSQGFEILEMNEVSPEEAETDYGIDVSSGVTMENGLIGLVASADLWEVSLVTFQSCPEAVVEDVRKPVKHARTFDWTEITSALRERGEQLRRF